MRGHSLGRGVTGGLGQGLGRRSPKGPVGWGCKTGTTPGRRLAEPAASGRPERPGMRGQAWEKDSLPRRQRQTDPQLPLLLPCALTQHSPTATLSLVTMATNGQMPFPRPGPSAHPTGGHFHSRREAQPQLPWPRSLRHGQGRASGRRHCSSWVAPRPQALPSQAGACTGRCRRCGATVPAPEGPSGKLKHSKIVLVFKKKKMTWALCVGPQPLQSVPRAPRPGSYWLLQPCEAEEPACFFLRLFRSRLFEVFRSLIFTWS